MSITFRRRIKVLPGIYLNLSRKGVSTSIGPRGLNLNLGKKGVYLNTGIPGTGLTNRQKLFGESNNNTDVPVLNENIQLLKSDDNNGTQDIISSEGLKGLEENLVESKLEITSLSKEIKDTIHRLSELESNISKKQNNFFSKLFSKKEIIENLRLDFKESSKYLEELKKQYDDSKADINIQFDKEFEDQYKKVVEAFEQLTQCHKIWDITSEYDNDELKSSAKQTVNREEVKFNLYNIEFIKSIYPAFHLQNANGGQLYIYPAFLLIMEKGGKLTLIDLKEISFNFNLQRFIEPTESIPSDTKIIDYSWAKVNKNGTPDMRFKGNYQTPVVTYGSLSFTSPNRLNELFYISNSEVAQNFASEFMSYLSILNSDSKETNLSNTPNITKLYFDSMKELADKFVSFITRVLEDKQFNNFICQLPSIKLLPFETLEELIHFYFFLDIIKCFDMTADITKLKSKEVFALIYLTAKKNGLSIDSYTNINLLYEEKLIKTYVNLFQGFKVNIEKPSVEDEMFQLSNIIGFYNKDWQNEYLTNLYRFASIVVKADGTISKGEEVALKKILNISERKEIISISNNKHQEENVSIAVQPKEETLDQALEELNSLIGLNAVKQEITSLINFVKIQKTRESTGLKSSAISYHIVFTGNPGTGKTTVARIVSEIYKNLGVILQGQLVETDRSGLVAEYVGQTGVKVNKIVDLALNGILFIDEAYSLVGENQDDFGKEAISTLIKRMEDDRDKLVVILAGYTNEMHKFINSNPGFESRFNRYIEFDDYSPEELLAIYKLQCKKLDYILTNDAEKKLTELFISAFKSRDKSFGNGRFVRNIFEKTIENQANRIACILSLTREILTTISINDIPTK